MIWVLSVGPRPNLQAARISGITSLLLQLRRLDGVDAMPGGDGVDRVDALPGIKTNLRFELGTMLTAFLGDGDRFPDFGLTIWPIQLSGSTSIIL